VTIEQCFEVEFWTTQYWSASAGIIDATSTAPQIIVFFMVPPGMGRFVSGRRFDPLEVPKNTLAKNVRPKLVALVGCVKRHIGKNIILLYQEHSSGNRIEPMPFEKLEQIVPRNVTKKTVPDRSKISMQNDYEVKYWARHFGVTQKHLRLAIEKVGNSAASVRKELQTRSLGA
jgi:hypothetical protein